MPVLDETQSDLNRILKSIARFDSFPSMSPVEKGRAKTVLILIVNVFK